MSSILSSISDEEHERWLMRAIALSEENVRDEKGGPFGAVIVKDGSVIAEGTNLVTSSCDPTAHAEIIAIRKASQAINHFNLEGCILYSSTEPCPMCLSAAYWARLGGVVFANTREEAGEAGFSDAMIYGEIPRSLQERSMPMAHKPTDIAQVAFELWNQSISKIDY